MEILAGDSRNPEDYENFLLRLAEGDPAFLYLLGKYRIEKNKIQATCWTGWFQLLGWWFAKLLMYGAAVFSLALVYAAGKAAADPLTYGLIGAAVYYALIQIFTPGRIRREVEGLKTTDESLQLQKLLNGNHEKEAD